MLCLYRRWEPFLGFRNRSIREGWQPAASG